jgi:hypothetical protein
VNANLTAASGTREMLGTMTDHATSGSFRNAARLPVSFVTCLYSIPILSEVFRQRCLGC